MSLHADGFAVTRGTALVASGSKLFMDIVGEMVADCDVGVAFPVTSEPAWLSVMRTQPSLVICDCDAPAENSVRPPRRLDPQVIDHEAVPERTIPQFLP